MNSSCKLSYVSLTEVVATRRGYSTYTYSHSRLFAHSWGPLPKTDSIASKFKLSRQTILWCLDVFHLQSYMFLRELSSDVKEKSHYEFGKPCNNVVRDSGFAYRPPLLLRHRLLPLSAPAKKASPVMPCTPLASSISPHKTSMQTAIVGCQGLIRLWSIGQ